VLAKIAQQKEAKGEATKIMATVASKFAVLESTKAANLQEGKKKASDYLKNVTLTERELLMLRVVGLEDEDLENIGGLVIQGVKLWNSTKGTLSEYDKNYTYGMFGNSITAAQKAVDLYQYASAVKNSYNQSKWKVEWQSKSAERACGVCKQTFKSMTLRKTLGKHHCRACGKVVCHICAANRIYMHISKRFERVCTVCLTDKNRNVGVRT
jgi:hypothetical protein